MEMMGEKVSPIEMLMNMLYSRFPDPTQTTVQEILGFIE
jgi:hypothetical protein